MTVHPKHAKADHEILDVIRKRWSPRAFDPTRTIARDELLRLFEAARWAPSSLNEQPWQFVVADRTRMPDVFEVLLATLNEKNCAWATAAPVLVLVAVRKMIERFAIENEHGWYDAGQAVAFLTLQATALDLSIRQMEGFDRARAREICAVPDSFQPAVVMAIGYAGDPDSLVLDKHRAAERQPRERRPLGDFVFEGKWGGPFAV